MSVDSCVTVFCKLRFQMEKNMIREAEIEKTWGEEWHKDSSVISPVSSANLKLKKKNLVVLFAWKWVSHPHHQSDSSVPPAEFHAARTAEGLGLPSQSWWLLGKSWAAGTPCAGSASESSGGRGAWRRSRWRRRCGSTWACGLWRWERWGGWGSETSAAPPSSAAQRHLEGGQREHLNPQSASYIEWCCPTWSHC